MDVYYMTDSIQYGSFRNPLYRDYEKFPYGTLENPLNSPPKSSQQSQQQQQLQQQRGYNMAQGGKSKSKSGKESCPFCKEQKKRPLGAYLRKRGQRINSESITEDVEECDERTEDQDLQEETTGAAGNHHQHHDHHHGASGRMVSGSGRYSRQESQDSDGK